MPTLVPAWLMVMMRLMAFSGIRVLTCIHAPNSWMSCPMPSSPTRGARNRQTCSGGPNEGAVMSAALAVR